MTTTSNFFHLPSGAIARTALLALWLVSRPGLADLSLGVHYDEPAAVATVLSKLAPGGEPIDVVSYSDVQTLIGAVADATIDMALLEEPLAPIVGVSAVRELYPSVLHVLYRGGSSNDGIEELLTSGKLWTGTPGGIGWRLSHAIAEDYGISDRATWLRDPWSEEPDVYFMFGGILDRDARNRLGGFELWSFDDPAKLMLGSVAEAFNLRYPNLRPFVLPAELYPELSVNAALTLSVSTILVARSNLADERVYEVAAEIDRAMPLIAAVYPLAGLPQPMRDTGARNLSLHPGAQRYLDRNKPSFLERYAEVFALLATLTVAVVSALVALNRRRRQTRKDRLDAYYSRVLAHRIDSKTSFADRQLAKQAIQTIQAEVFELVAAERIDADAALVAFLALSNQLLNEANLAARATMGSE